MRQFELSKEFSGLFTFLILTFIIEKFAATRNLSLYRSPRSPDQPVRLMDVLWPARARSLLLEVLMVFKDNPVWKTILSIIFGLLDHLSKLADLEYRPLCITTRSMSLLAMMATLN